MSRFLFLVYVFVFLSGFYVRLRGEAGGIVFPLMIEIILFIRRHMQHSIVQFVRWQ